MADLHGFIDEAGDRSRSVRSSQHFVMAGVVVADADLPAVAAMQARLRTDLGRRPGDPIHWQNLRSHAHRVHAARTVGQTPELTVSSIVVCKRQLSAAPLPDAVMTPPSATFLAEIRRIVTAAIEANGGKVRLLTPDPALG